MVVDSRVVRTVDSLVVRTVVACIIVVRALVVRLFHLASVDVVHILVVVVGIVHVLQTSDFEVEILLQCWGSSSVEEPVDRSTKEHLVALEKASRINYCKQIEN